MSLEGPKKQQKPEHEPNDPKHIELKESFPLRTTKNMGRRTFVFGAAAGASLGLGKLAANETTDRILGDAPKENPETKRQRGEIEKQLKSFEEARKKGLLEWGDKWLDSFQKGFKQYGFNFPKAMAEFSEEGLRTRLLVIDSLDAVQTKFYAQAYDAANTAFFVGYAYMLFIPNQKDIQQLQQTPDGRGKGQKNGRLYERPFRSYTQP